MSWDYTFFKFDVVELFIELIEKTLRRRRCNCIFFIYISRDVAPASTASF